MTPHLNDARSRMDKLMALKAEFEEQRRVLLQQVEQLDTKIIETQQEYGAIYNEQTPILRLPVETACLIFIFATSIGRRGRKEKVHDRESLMEVVVSHVCHQWRSISIGFPKLWTTFCFEANPSVEAPLRRLEAYLDRSAALPLRIWFDFTKNSEDPHNFPLVAKAIEHAHRWQHFTIYSRHRPNGQEVTECLVQLYDASAPMLEYLTIVESDDEQLADIQDVPDMIDMMESVAPHIFGGGAPKLTYLLLDGYSLKCLLPPLSNISILRVEKFQPDTAPVFELPVFLEMCSLPSLSQLSLAGDLLALDFDLPHGTLINMPNLTRIRVSDFDLIWVLLSAIRAPKLDTLLIRNSHTYHDVGTSTASPASSYVFPALRKLYVIGSNVAPSIVPAFTLVTSQATDVFITYDGLQTSLFETIVDRHYSGVVWPQLKTLFCNIPGMKYIDKYLTFASNRPKQSFCFLLHNDLLYHWTHTTPTELYVLYANALMQTADVEFELDEPFWPQDACLGPKYDFRKYDSFDMGRKFY